MATSRRRRTTLALAAVLATLPAVASAARVEPAKPARSFAAVLRYPGGSEIVAWQAPESFAVRLRHGQPLLGGTFAHRGRIYYRYGQKSPGSLLTRTFAARPDASPLLAQLRGPADFALAQVRAGKLKLRPAGAAAWRVRLFVPANACAALGPGSVELWLRRADLLPLRLVERHGRRVTHAFSLAYREVGGRLPVAAFTPDGPAPVDYRDDKGFVRSSPAAAAARLSYAPRLPRSLPRGFSLAVAGWAPRSATTGPEGSIPPARELFAAVYRRGSERIDVTQRLAPPGGWAADPFGAECVRQLGSTAKVGRARAVYAGSVSTTPHLYWRSGRLLYTVSGPFPKAELVAIARSLRPVS